MSRLATAETERDEPSEPEALTSGKGKDADQRQSGSIPGPPTSGSDLADAIP